MKNNNKVNGFTLLELVIIVATFALLVQLASTSYRSHVLKTSRLSRKIVLYDAYLASQGCFLNQLSYKTCKPGGYEGFRLSLEGSSALEARWVLVPLPGHVDYQDEACFQWVLNSNQSLTVYSKSGDENTAQCRA